MFGLEAAITQHQGLGEGQGRLTEMKQVEIVAVGGVVLRHLQPRFWVACGQILANGRRFGHRHMAIEHGGHRAQRVDLKKRLVSHAWRKSMHHQLIRRAELLKHPQGAKRAGTNAVMQRNHDKAPDSLYSDATSIPSVKVPTPLYSLRYAPFGYV